MRTTRWLVPLALATLVVACGSVPNDPGPRVFTPAGVIRGTVVYQGPRPCSRNGHIVGNAIVLVFDRRNPPPPNGLATTAVNFGDVTGDRLFANEPRYPGNDMTYCPLENGFAETVTASSSFEIAPLAGGSYALQAFFDSTGDWLPEFKIRDLPELGDIGGGDVDTADALKPINAGNQNYQPRFLPVEVGTPQPLSLATPPPNVVPNFTIPSTGFVRDDVTVTISVPLTTTRPYFFARGESSSVGAGGTFRVVSGQSSDQPAPGPVPAALESPSDPDVRNYAPVLTMPQDIQVLAPPSFPPSAAAAYAFEGSFPRLRLQWGVAPSELAAATDPTLPFHMQIAPFMEGSAQGGGFAVWQNGAYDPAQGTYVPQQIAEGGNLPLMWPVVVLSKLVDDYAPDQAGTYHTRDPASLTTQGDAQNPVIILQGITEAGNLDPTKPDSLYDMVIRSFFGGTFFDAKAGRPMIFKQDHLTVLLRPSVICFDTLFDASNPDKRGTLVTPYLTGASADDPQKQDQPIVPPTLLANDGIALQSVANLVSKVVPGCLPKGRYAIGVVYPDGQAWTVPNEAGACSGSEGATDYPNLICTVKQRPVLYSQGNRAVVEIVDAQDPANCQDVPGKVPSVPAACLPKQ
jgi:hypothetical protein